MAFMRSAGIREARQNLSVLLEEVARGRELTLTDRGKPVACLVPPDRVAARPFPGRAAFRASLLATNPQLSVAVLEGREERG